MNFASDNTGPVHPKVLEAISAAGAEYDTPYANDKWTERACGQLRDVFNAPEAEVHFVATGTSANALILSCLSRPWDVIFSAPQGHIHVDEGNAVESLTGGAKVVPVGSLVDKMTAAGLETAMADWGHKDVHSPGKGPVSITQVTERGTLYTVEEIQSISNVAHDAGCLLHMDGARYSNACAALGLSAPQMSREIGVDALSFGGTKNGGMAVEAAVFFDPEHSGEFERRRMRSGHLLSKSKFLGAQMSALLTDGLWLELAELANSAMKRLAAGLRDLGAVFDFKPQANMAFVRLPRAVHHRLFEGGVKYNIMQGSIEGTDPNELLQCRLVCDWACESQKVDRFLEIASS